MFRLKKILNRSSLTNVKTLNKSMSYFKLPNFDQNKWSAIKADLIGLHPKSLDDIKSLISKYAFELNEDHPFDSLDQIVRFYSKNELVDLLGKIVRTAATLDENLPSGRLPRLSSHCTRLDLSRRQVRCLLANMLACTVERSPQNPYWVSFANWLGDGRQCANVYLRTLVEYFKQSFDDARIDQDEIITFERRKLDKERLSSYLASDKSEFKAINFEMKSSIGDKSHIEVDFANKDIGHGVTGTQEEILFGKHPEICVSILFADTMTDEEAIVIYNCRKVAIYEDPDNAFRMQLKRESLYRELAKAYTGFSAFSSKSIDTGHWGCGAFCGNRHLKTLIQWLASSASSNDLNYFCYGDEGLYRTLKPFVDKMIANKIKPGLLWSRLNAFDSDETHVEEKDFIFVLEKKIFIQ